jgi:murein DD-endopeptidase MepM/ murein hydrolase activator NlpD
MGPEHWTILIVPPGTGTTRTIRVGPGARRALLAGSMTAVFLVAGAITILFTPYGTPSAHLLLAQNARLQSQMARLDTRLSALGDTLASLGARDQQIRLLAGLPNEPVSTASDAAPDTAVGAFAGIAAAIDGIGSTGGIGGRDRAPQVPDGKSLASMAPNSLPKPFEGRLAFSKNIDIEGMIRRAAELSQSFRAVSDTLAKNYERLASTPSIMPTTGWLSSQFSQSRFHPVLHLNRPHEGIDLSAPMGAPIIAPAAGRVISVTVEPGYGNTFQIDHGNGIVTKFAHCSRIVVHVGQMVTRGQLIATVGNTGLATGPHLHYEVHVNGQPVDPLKYVLPEKVAR